MSISLQIRKRLSPDESRAAAVAAEALAALSATGQDGELLYTHVAPRTHQFMYGVQVNTAGARELLPPELR